MTASCRACASDGDTQSVEGGLYITGNSALKNLDSFASLTHIGGSLYVSGNGALKNLDGLRSLESVRARRPSRRPKHIATA